MRNTDCLAKMKREGVPIAVLTAYDAPTAGTLAAAGVDVLLVGDSVGTNLLGYASERDVTLADMCHHVGAVRRGAPRALIMGDLPYRTYETAAMALESARQLVAAGADIVKFEGAHPEIAAALAEASFDVCGHIGLEPQHHQDKRLKAKLAEEARRLLEEALALQRAGIGLIILEMIPEEVAGTVTEVLKIPTIGIGAGRKTNGQVLVITDMLGFAEKNFRHNKRYQDFGRLMEEAARTYVRDVRERNFPADTNVFHMDSEELAAFEGRAVPS